MDGAALGQLMKKYVYQINFSPSGEDEGTAMSQYADLFYKALGEAIVEHIQETSSLEAKCSDGGTVTGSVK